VSQKQDQPKGPSLSYQQAGVNIDAGNSLIENIKPLASRTFRPGVMTGLGGFGALFELPIHRFREPVLVSGTDGVGTKLKLANQLGRHDSIGIDLVAMCVNDIIVAGAEPLFFLDYYATGKLDVATATQVISGIAKGCELSGCALTGGETAEMPGMYEGEDYDLAGFAVGIVEKSRILRPENVAPGDVLLGLASSGPHSNGYSLIRKIIEVDHTDLGQELDGKTIGDRLLEPTHLYVKPLLALMDEIDIHAMAHITGGGLPENLPRVLPAETEAQIDISAWPRPAIFSWLQDKGGVEENELLRTFNCGIGMVVCVSADDVDKATRLLQEQGEVVYQLGHIAASDSPKPLVKIKG